MNLLGRSIWTGLSVLMFVLTLVVTGISVAQTDTGAEQKPAGTPVIFSGDTLFFLQANLGPFSPQQRAEGINLRLNQVLAERMNSDRIHAVHGETITNIMLDALIVMSVTNEDAALRRTDRVKLGEEYAAVLKKALKETEARYSFQTLLISALIMVLLLVAAFLIFWGMTKVFPKGYEALEGWEGKIFRSIKFRSHEILSAGSLTSFFIFLLKGVRLALSLAVLYFLIINVLSLFPWTRTWNVKPVLSGILASILVTVTTFAILKAGNTFWIALLKKVDGWRGTLIKSIRVKTVEVVSEESLVQFVKGTVKIVKFVLLIAIAYLYVTIIFSFFEFTQTWAKTLFGYVLRPLGSVLTSFISFLPNLFFILVIVFVTRYVIAFTRLFFLEVGKGTITLPGFYTEWAQPTYKIVRFLILAFAIIVIFPYLPGSDSPFFQGISIFLGVLFSLGSTSAIANVVAGVVLTYMRPFKIGDRVKITDAVGDVVEKTLLVTRIRTIKNVDITIPNSMVLGSHIINFSTSAQERGLILHTSVTISYDVPWKKVHELLIAAAKETEHILEEPKPFVLQTSLDDSYVAYELNAYTDQPNMMAKIYSELHENIQDKFNEAGVEIMSPHYSAVRDGNRTAIPEDYLPKAYSPPAFRIFPLANMFNQTSEKEKQEKT